jgi:hypothetical protein
MEKIEILMSEHKDEFMKIVEGFYKEKYPVVKHKTKTINYSVFTMNRTYENSTFTKTYVQLVKDLSKIFSYQEFISSFGKFVSDKKDKFTESAIRKNTIVKINDEMYLSVNSSTDMKKQHLNNFFNINQIKVTITPCSTTE